MFFPHVRITLVPLFFYPFLTHLLTLLRMTSTVYLNSGKNVKFIFKFFLTYHISLLRSFLKVFGSRVSFFDSA
jgi:hypothetical protein